MKLFNNFGKLALVALTVIISSCSKDDPAPAPATVLPSSGSFITAKINGRDFSSAIFGQQTATCNRVGTGPNALIQILGLDLGSNSISINLIDLNIVEGQTYAINPSLDGTVLGYVSTNASASYDTGNCDGFGTLTVTAFTDTKIEGTFSFTGKNGENCAEAAKVITNGSFRGAFPQ